MVKICASLWGMIALRFLREIFVDFGEDLVESLKQLCRRVAGIEIGLRLHRNTGHPAVVGYVQTDLLFLNVNKGAPFLFVGHDHER
jgi:hypothetical protein